MAAQIPYPKGYLRLIKENKKTFENNNKFK